MKIELSEILADHARNCAMVAGLLVGQDSTNLDALYWYDMVLREAVSAEGQERVARWNRGARQKDEIAGNYDLVNLYYAPPSGDGLDRSGATVWRCESLDSRPWFDGDSPVRQALEANADAIIAEYHAVAREIRTHPDNASLVDRGRWTGMFLYGVQGVRNDELCAACPTVTRVVEGLSLCKSFGFVMFSGMEPHTHVEPHCGSSNLRLRHHLGIEVPEPAASRLRVGREWRRWEQSRCFAFDDSFEHEVVHEGERTRIVLVVDVWHPSLTPAEVRVLSHPVFGRFGKVPSSRLAPGGKEQERP